MSAGPTGSKGTRSTSACGRAGVAGAHQRLGQEQPGEGAREPVPAHLERGAQAHRRPRGASPPPAGSRPGRAAPGPRRGGRRRRPAPRFASAARDRLVVAPEPREGVGAGRPQLRLERHAPATGKAAEAVGRARARAPRRRAQAAAAAAVSRPSAAMSGRPASRARSAAPLAHPARARRGRRPRSSAVRAGVLQLGLERPVAHGLGDAAHGLDQPRRPRPGSPATDSDQAALDSASSRASGATTPARSISSSARRLGRQRLGRVAERGVQPAAAEGVRQRQAAGVPGPPEQRARPGRRPRPSRGGRPARSGRRRAPASSSAAPRAGRPPARDTASAR